jgi:hypothetical protein
VIAAAEILGRFTDLGASVRMDGRRLVLTAGSAPIPAELVAAARERKNELVRLLAPRPEPAPASAESWHHWLASLDLDSPPGDVPQAAWTLFIDASRQFIADWGATAAALGWTAEDLFGRHPIKPYARIDRAGLCWLVGAGRVVVLTAGAAAIETAGGSRLTYRRRPAATGGDATVLPGFKTRERPDDAPNAVAALTIGAAPVAE